MATQFLTAEMQADCQQCRATEHGGYCETCQGLYYRDKLATLGRDLHSIYCGRDIFVTVDVVEDTTDFEGERYGQAMKLFAKLRFLEYFAQELVDEISDFLSVDIAAECHNDDHDGEHARESD